MQGNTAEALEKLDRILRQQKMYRHTASQDKNTRDLDGMLPKIPVWLRQKAPDE